jgi:hypothetical protein
MAAFSNYQDDFPTKAREVKNDPGRAEGKFALQVHGGQDCDVWFKDIEIRME